MVGLLAAAGELRTSGHHRVGKVVRAPTWAAGRRRCTPRADVSSLGSDMEIGTRKLSVGQKAPTSRSIGSAGPPKRQTRLSFVLVTTVVTRSEGVRSPYRAATTTTTTTTTLGQRRLLAVRLKLMQPIAFFPLANVDSGVLDARFPQQHWSGNCARSWIVGSRVASCVLLALAQAREVASDLCITLPWLPFIKVSCLRFFLFEVCLS